MQDDTTLIDFLLTDPGAGPPRGTGVHPDAGIKSNGVVHKTHISVVVLVGQHAYKLKRAVRLPYLDFSDPSRRLAACQRELELNRRTAPDLYLAVRHITRRPDGTLELDGTGDLVDAVVQMRRFGSNDLLDQMAQEHRLTTPLMTGLASALAKFHEQAAVSPDTEGAARIAAILSLNEQSQVDTAQTLESDRPVELNRTLRQALDQHRALLDDRARAGKVRLCHGDLHLGNICVWNDQAVPFDCLEFNESMATTDIFYDLAFLLMDLWRYREYGLANMVMNRYMDHSDDISGLPLLPFFMALRASIRAQVLATQAGTASPENRAHCIDRSREFLDLAFQLLQPRPVRLVAIGGLSGTGKSTLASALADSVGPVPGARVLSSDRIRKQLAGVDVQATLPAHTYTQQASDRVYAEQVRRATQVLALGHAVIADAVFSREAERVAIEACAAPLNVPFTGIWLTAAANTMIDRVEARRNDPSDATVEVVRKQLTREPGDISWTTVQSDSTLEATLAQIRELPSHAAGGRGV